MISFLSLTIFFIYIDCGHPRTIRYEQATRNHREVSYQESHPLHVEIDRSPESCLHAHNVIRNLHGEASLVWDADLAYDAETWAVFLAETKQFIHSNLNGYGENLFEISGSKATCANAVQAWYSEIRMYDFSNPGFSDTTGHFTQLVWRSTTRVGVGIVFVPDLKTTYIVARYTPPGNAENRLFQTEVPRRQQGSGIPSIRDFTLSSSPNSINSDITVTVTDRKPCKDFDSHCSAFVKEGFCTSVEWKEYMQESCAKTCAFCVSGPPTNGKWTAWMPVSECLETCLRNDERICASPFPSDNGQICVGPRMRQIPCSRASCPSVTSGCVDVKDSTSCAAYKQMGYCDGGTYQPWMLTNCKKTCLDC